MPPYCEACDSFHSTQERHNFIVANFRLDDTKEIEE